MANLVKIKEVYLYAGYDQHVQECYDIKKILEDNNIPHQFLVYADDSQHKGIFDSLSTWPFKGGPRPREEFRFPLMYWRNLYDDYENDLELVIGIDEFNASGFMTKNVPIV